MRRARKINQPLIRLWDGDWKYRGRVSNAISASFQWKLNETGVAVIEIPLHHFLAKWVLDVDHRLRNVHITMDRDGARWGGRMISAVADVDDSGKERLILTFNHDYEELRYILAWCNPFLPAALQFPRSFLLAGPSIYMLKLALFVNLIRIYGNLWNIPADPLNPANQTTLGMATWWIVVKPSSFFGDSSLWTILHSRFRTWADMAESTLEDAQLMVVCRRWLTGDPQPWPGFTPRHGALVIDIVDKSGYYSGTGTSGTIFDGLTRTIAQMADDFITETLDLLTDSVDDTQYLVQNWMGTMPARPWVILRCGDRSPITKSTFTITPATAIQVVAGGHSMPFVNETMSAAIQTLAGGLGGLFGFSALGNIVDTLLKPIYEDTVLAWWNFRHIVRAMHAGGSHYNEMLADDNSRAYSLSSLLALRTAFWATRSRFSHTVEFDAAAVPWIVGDNGCGHFFLGDRIGSTIKGGPVGRVWVDQVQELTFTLDRSSTPGWKCVIGDRKDNEEPQARMLRRIREVTSALSELGVL